MTAITRRRALGLSAATAAGALLPAAWSGRGAAAGRLENLVLWGPPAGPSIALAHLVRHGESRRQVGDLSFKIWRTPDQMRAGFVSGDIRISGIPSYVGANLYNKGLPVRMVNIMTWGVLYLLSADDGVSTLADIAGRTVTMPFRNDMPDLVFRYITAKAGLIPGRDFELQYATTPLEVVQMMVAGKADICVNAEPAATAAVLRGKRGAVPIRRVLSLQDEWGKATGGPPRIPQAGLLADAHLAEAHPDLVKAIHADCVRSSQWAVNNPASAGRLAEDYMGVKAPVVELSLPFTNLRTTAAAAARPEMEAFFTRLAELSPKIIGGKLPDAAFYLDV